MLHPSSTSELVKPPLLSTTSPPPPYHRLASRSQCQSAKTTQNKSTLATCVQPFAGWLSLLRADALVPLTQQVTKKAPIPPGKGSATTFGPAKKPVPPTTAAPTATGKSFPPPRNLPPFQGFYPPRKGTSTSTAASPASPAVMQDASAATCSAIPTKCGASAAASASAGSTTPAHAAGSSSTKSSAAAAWSGFFQKPAKVSVPTLLLSSHTPAKLTLVPSTLVTDRPEPDH